MVFYFLFGCSSKEEYDNYFKNTLMLSNVGYDYFVNWKKVFKNISSLKEDFRLLNPILVDDNPQVKFKEILENNRDLIPLVNLLLAFRDNSIDVLDDEENMKFKRFSFDKNSDLDEILYFFNKTNFFNNLDDIDDIYSYIVGIEVGLNSHGRKNRGGEVFDSIIKNIIHKKIGFDSSLSFPDDNRINLFANKTFNNVIYKNGEPKFVVQTNFAKSTGGKTKSTITDVLESQNELYKRGIIFIWVCDGPVWKSKKQYEFVSKNLNLFVNKQIFEDYFEEIFSLDFI